MGPGPSSSHTIGPMRITFGLRDKPDQVFPVKLGEKAFDASLKDIVYDSPKGAFPHPKTMTCKLMAEDTVLLEQEYYS